jgi:hypothetical protein
VLTNLVPVGAQRDLTADRAAELLRGIRPRDTAGKTLRGLAIDLVSEIRQLDLLIAKAAADIQTAVSASGTTLTELCGIGALTAGKILGRVGTIDRFRSAGAFATYTGIAPIDVSSGDVVRHRLSRAGGEQTLDDVVMKVAGEKIAIFEEEHALLVVPRGCELQRDGGMVGERVDHFEVRLGESGPAADPADGQCAPHSV